MYGLEPAISGNLQGSVMTHCAWLTDSEHRDKETFHEDSGIFATAVVARSCLWSALQASNIRQKSLGRQPSIFIHTTKTCLYGPKDEVRF